jgi:hypothetical protein
VAAADSALEADQLLTCRERRPERAATESRARPTITALRGEFAAFFMASLGGASLAAQPFVGKFPQASAFDAVDENQRKEQFSNAYLHAVAAVADFSTAKPSVDDDSVDWTLSGRRGPGNFTASKLDVRLKCTHVADLTSDHLRYALKVKNYSDLIDIRVLIPRILVCVLVPEDAGTWLAQTEEDMILRCCGYRVSLRGRPATQNKQTETVSLPRSQILTPDTLIAMVRQISQTGML